jgi:hypothetical protein
MASKLPNFPFALESDGTLPPDIRAMTSLRNRVISRPLCTMWKLMATFALVRLGSSCFPASGLT